MLRVFLLLLGTWSAKQGTAGAERAFQGAAVTWDGAAWWGHLEGDALGAGQGGRRRAEDTVTMSVLEGPYVHEALGVSQKLRRKELSTWRKLPQTRA